MLLVLLKGKFLNALNITVDALCNIEYRFGFGLAFHIVLVCFEGSLGIHVRSISNKEHKWWCTLAVRGYDLKPLEEHELMSSSKKSRSNKVFVIVLGLSENEGLEGIIDMIPRASKKVEDDVMD
ncbi:hypothetical protein Tco_1484544 [Tanacetum coccineum]